MATKKQAVVPGSGFNTYLLGIDETWWVRDHPFNTRCVRVKRKVKQIEEAELALEQLRSELDVAVAEMNEERANA